MGSDLLFYPFPLPPAEGEENGDEQFRADKFEFRYVNGDAISEADSNLNSLVDNVIRTILTTKGSIPTHQEQGSNLNNLLLSGFNEATIFEDVALILLDVETQIKNIQQRQDNGTSNAVLESIQLNSLEVLEGGKLNISLVVRNTKQRDALIVLPPS